MTTIQIVFFAIAAIVVFGLAAWFCLALCRVAGEADDRAERMARNMKGRQE